MSTFLQVATVLRTDRKSKKEISFEKKKIEKLIKDLYYKEHYKQFTAIQTLGTIVVI